MDAINGNPQSETVAHRGSLSFRDSVLFDIVFVKLHILAGEVARSALSANWK